MRGHRTSVRRSIKGRLRWVTVPKLSTLEAAPELAQARAAFRSAVGTYHARREAVNAHLLRYWDHPLMQTMLFRLASGFRGSLLDP